MLRRLLVRGGLLLGVAAHATVPGSGELPPHDRTGPTQGAVSLDPDVVYRVSGLVAAVALRQRFRDTGKDWPEGDYLLPLPPRGSDRL
ncbi:MAG: hypothetical protein ABI389_05350 [Rhodanobacter sp.]